MPASIESFIRDNTASYGKIKLVLKQNRYYVESSYPETLQHLLRDPTIQAGILREDEPEVKEEPVASSSTAQPPVFGNLLSNRAPQRKDIEIAGLNKKKKEASEDKKPSADQPAVVASSSRRPHHANGDGPSSSDGPTPIGIGEIPEDLYDIRLDVDGDAGPDEDEEGRVYSFEIKPAEVEVSC